MQQLRKLVAIAFFFTYLAAVFQLEQLTKIPVLFQHYQEHIRMEGKISFIAYLEEHYILDDHSNADYARDMQLPFKTTPHHFFMLMTAATPKPLVEEVNAAANIPFHYINPLNDTRLLKPFAGAIFQPPRLG